ncbi:MAG: UDP-N-acetylmuramate--L-alanine ligase [Actinomycetota bacterium]
MNPYRPPPGSIPTLTVPDLGDVRSAHLIGIGGAGMSGLARLLLARGLRISGSDLKESPALTQLRASGAEVFIGHEAANIGEAEALVISTAIGRENPEVIEAVRREIPVFARAQVLAALMREHRGVAIAGTHGKTTTTSMLAGILERIGSDPTYIIGGDLNESGSNARAGGGDLFVAEADESDGSFLLLEPEVALITNVEDDHLDFFTDREDIEAAFVAFCLRSEKVVACADDAGSVRVVEAAGVQPLWYGERAPSGVRIVDVSPVSAGTRARLHVTGTGTGVWEGELEVPVPGRHYAMNAAGAVAAAILLGAPVAAAAEAVRSYGGVRRRWERQGAARGAEFVDDYAHHPTEIAATLAAARDDDHGRIVAVFQPHRYTRTATMWRSLGESLRGADLVVVTDVYGAGEDPVAGITGKLVVDGLVESQPGKRAVYVPRRPDLAAFLAREVREGDLVLTLGAGDITMLAKETQALLRSGGRER